MARTISMQFEGNWSPVSDIVVDKVGKYAYIIGSPHDTPVIMDVTLDVRTKVMYRASGHVGGEGRHGSTEPQSFCIGGGGGR